MVPITDGVVTLRAMQRGDAEALIAGRDDVFHRFLGEGSPNPAPTAVIEVAGEVVGWVDHDTDADHDWLRPGEVNVGYHVFASARGRGYATRSVLLLLEHLAESSDHHTATLLIDPANHGSLAVARRAGFAAAGEVNGQRYFRRPLTTP
jgi:RimJ/RimL family protein N-acetyltransferase